MTTPSERGIVQHKADTELTSTDESPTKLMSVRLPIVESNNSIQNLDTLVS